MFEVLDKVSALKDFSKEMTPFELKQLGEILDLMEEQLNVKVCPVCGEYVRVSDMVYARFDTDVLICPQCSIDGN